MESTEAEHSRMIDVMTVGCDFTLQLVAGKIMEQGPVLVVSFTAQQINVVHDATGNVVEGDPVYHSFYLPTYEKYVVYVF